MKKFGVLPVLLAAVAAASPQISREQEKELFSRVDEMFAQVSDIMGMKVNRPVPRAVISREQIRKYIEERMAETMTPEELRSQEVVLKKFGFLPQDYDLKSEMVDVLTEQAAAFYDFKQKKLYLATWTPSAMQDMAVVHELSHALADQHFNLEKFIKKSGDDDDAATARGAVVEGQASWVMTEYLARQMGQSLKNSPRLAQSAVDSSGDAAKQFPVLGGAPLYVQQSLMFPYTEGLLFQQAVFQKLGRAAFHEVFRRPPASSQQVIHPEKYFAKVMPTKPSLPGAQLPPGFKKTMDGTLGELDHQVLLQQYLGEDHARELAPRWRGGRYALWENSKSGRSVLYYAVEWANEGVASQYFADYKKIAGKKWKRLEVTTDEPNQVSGAGDDGKFTWTLRGAVFASIEGI